MREDEESMNINQETVQYVAALAKLTVSEDEQGRIAKDLERILEYIGTMNELNTEGIEPMSHVLPIHNVFREDVVTNDSVRDELLKHAPKSKDGCFVVPKTVE